MPGTPFDSNKETGEIVWGIRVPTVLKRDWMSLAGIIGVPANRLVAFVLEDWFKKNVAVFREKEGRYALSQLILRQDQSASGRVLPKNASQPFDENNEADSFKTNMSIRGVTLDTRLRLKVMAIGKGVPIYRLLDEIVDKAWQKEKDKIPERPISSRRISKEAGKILRKLAGS